MLGFLVMGILAALDHASTGGSAAKTSTPSAQAFQQMQNPIGPGGVVQGGIASGLVTTAPPGSSSATIIQGAITDQAPTIKSGIGINSGQAVITTLPNGVQGVGTVTQNVKTTSGIVAVPTGIVNLLKSGRL